MGTRTLRRCLVGLSALVVLSCGTDQVASYTEADTGAEITVDAGDRFELRLVSNRTTGFSWVTVPGEIDHVVDLVSEAYEEPDRSAVGAAGIQTFEYEATGAGAAILRLEYVRPFDEPAVPERIVEYIVRVDGAPWLPVTTGDPPTTGTATAPDPTTSTTEPPRPVIDVETLFDGEGPRQAAVRGFLVTDETGTRICSTLLESFPPQCGWAWVVVPNPDGLGHVFDEAQGVRWTPSWIVLPGRFDGVRLIADGGAPDVTVTADDSSMVEAFWAFATTGTGFAELPLAEELGLGLGADIDRTVAAGELSRRAAWVIEAEEYQGFAGPFSVLDLPEGDYDVLIGPHPRCAAPAVPAPDGFENHRRVSVQPTGATSCIEWWTIDFFVGDAGRIDAITLDLFGP